MPAPIDLTGRKFGKITAVRLGAHSASGNNRRWVCVCECGNESLVHARNLLQGMTRSCGCLRGTLSKVGDTEEQKLEARIARIPFSGCWIWIGWADSKGYGKLHIDGGRRQAAHRFFWEAAHGKIQSGLHVLHRCDVPACVNPDHLFLGTHKDNMEDCARKGRFNPRNAKATHCLRGHAFDESNTYYAPKTGVRGCKECQRARTKAYMHKRRISQSHTTTRPAQ